MFRHNFSQQLDLHVQKTLLVQVHIFFSLNFSHSFLQLFKNFDAIRCSSLACLIDVLQR